MSQGQKIQHENSEIQEYSGYPKWREKVGGYMTAAYLIGCLVLTIVAGFLLLGK